MNSEDENLPRPGVLLRRVLKMVHKYDDGTIEYHYAPVGQLVTITSVNPPEFAKFYGGRQIYWGTLDTWETIGLELGLDFEFTDGPV